MPVVHDPGTPERNEEIYRELKKGMGRHYVNDDNVFQLIAIAQREGHRLLETELREWQSPEGVAIPSAMAPTRGFNRENAKR